LLLSGTNSDPLNINMPPLGAFFGPDPLNGKTISVFSPSFPTNDYRPLQSYGDIWIAGHGSYANYNSLQTTFQKQTGRATFLADYTFSKVLGTRDGESQNGAQAGPLVDPFNLNANYGVLTFDHTHIFNAAYVFNLGTPFHGSRFIAGALNGWQMSGVITWQSGAPLQPNSNGDLNASWGNVNVGGSYYGVSPQTWVGSNATGLTLEPILTCDPRTGLKSGQYFNPNCFAPPPQGSLGDIIWPYIKGPAFFDTDLGIFKTFHVTERQSLQFRFSAFNFINHPNGAFNQNGDGDIHLNFGAGGTNNLLTSTNQNTSTTGYPAYTVGNRLVEFAVKYYF
jgi:hypothetical protein